jgi:multidrug resistance efflux pump
VLSLRLVGTKAQRPDATLNAYLDQFVALATELKKRELVQRAETYNAQLKETQARLSQTEGELESYRVGTITLPSEGTPVAPGIDMTRDPTFNNYFNKRLQLGSLERDRAEIERVARLINGGASDANTVNRLLSIPTLQADPGSEALKRAITELNTAESNLRVLREKFTDASDPVRNAQQSLATSSARRCRRRSTHT